MKNKITDTLLPVVKVSFYHGERKIESYFTLDSVNDAPSLEVPIRKARDFLATFGLTQADVSLYLIDKVNGEWRTDWELSPNGVVLDHPWKPASKVAS